MPETRGGHSAQHIARPTHFLFLMCAHVLLLLRQNNVSASTSFESLEGSARRTTYIGLGFVLIFCSKV